MWNKLGDFRCRFIFEEYVFVLQVFQKAKNSHGHTKLPSKPEKQNRKCEELAIEMEVWVWKTYSHKRQIFCFFNKTHCVTKKIFKKIKRASPIKTNDWILNLVWLLKVYFHKISLKEEQSKTASWKNSYYKSGKPIFWNIFIYIISKTTTLLRDEAHLYKMCPSDALVIAVARIWVYSEL